MNSLVLKPCRWVVFLLVIPEETPSSGLRRTDGLATGARLRGAAREARDTRRRWAADVFLVRRLTAVGFFDPWRAFPAPALCVGLPPPFEGPRKRTQKKTSPPGSGPGCRFSP